jgi:hypothetical protein
MTCPTSVKIKKKFLMSQSICFRRQISRDEQFSLTLNLL